MAAREKLSTTVSPHTLRYLEQKVQTGEAANIAEAVDILIAKARRIENRERLAKATSRYFDEMPARAAAEENALAQDLASASNGIDFDHEL